jgi:hypothetical protein
MFEIPHIWTIPRLGAKEPWFFNAIHIFPMKLRAKELEFPGYIWHIQMQQVCQQGASKKIIFPEQNQGIAPRRPKFHQKHPTDLTRQATRDCWVDRRVFSRVIWQWLFVCIFATKQLCWILLISVNLYLSVCEICHVFFLEPQNVVDGKVVPYYFWVVTSVILGPLWSS